MAGSNGTKDEVWVKTVDRVKQAVISPGLWRAVEKTVAIVWEGDVFVVGLAAADGHFSSTLNTRDNQMSIERALREVTGDNNLKLRVIDGNHVEDWEHAKKRDAAAQEHATQSVQRRQSETTSFSSWDAIYDQVSRLWANFENRALTSGRGRYIDAALDILIKATENGLYPETGKGDELAERGLSRVLERIANMTGSDAVVISYLFVQKRKS